jgi:hypothetical protein
VARHQHGFPQARYLDDQEVLRFPAVAGDGQHFPLEESVAVKLQEHLGGLGVGRGANPELDEDR